jgi:hypothetical protein
MFRGFWFNHEIQTILIVMERQSLCMCMPCIEQTLYCFLGFTLIITYVYEQVFVQPIYIPFFLVYIGNSLCYYATYFEFSRRCTFYTRNLGVEVTMSTEEVIMSCFLSLLLFFLFSYPRCHE